MCLSFRHVVKLTAISLIAGMPSFAGLIQDPGGTGGIVMGVALTEVLLMSADQPISQTISRAATIS
jgi:hypothetical protein